MVAELLWGLLLSLGKFFMGFLSGRSRLPNRSWAKKPGGPQASNTHDVLGNLQSFTAWSEDIKLEMSCDNPSLYELLGSLAFSMRPIEEGSVQTSFLGRTLERNLGRQLGCLLVQRTQGETQKFATQWLSATNGWEAWRQINLSFLSKFLNSLVRTNQDDQPSSCLQPVPAWKESVVGHQELLEEESQLKRDQACKQNKGELSRVNFPQNSRQQNKQQQQKQELARRGKGKGTPQEKGEAYKPLPQPQRGKGEPNQLPNKAQRACTDKLHKKEGKGTTTPSFKKELTNKKSTLWCHNCRKKGHNAQACWWNGNQRAHKPSQPAWRRTNKKKELEQRQGNQSFAAWLASHKRLMDSFEKEICMRRRDPMSVLASSDGASSKKPWGTYVDSSADKSFASHHKLSPAQSTTQLASMELHDHSLSSESSSCMPLDEDHTSFQHVMSCVCHVHDHVSDVVCMPCDEGLAVQGGELSTHSFPPLQEQKPPSKKKKKKLEEHNRVDYTLNSFQQQQDNNNKKLQDKNRRASKSKPVDSLEATPSVCHASLS